MYEDECHAAHGDWTLKPTLPFIPGHATIGLADIELQPLSSINSVVDRLQHGDVASRVILGFATA